ncbi:hypothetical protein LTR70_000057 [Exophiala xenobiotica]|uniref:Integral membrane protein n=1 Tax=Lithohypha guttulata TaxID=1690604 RepID=A0ABR0KPB0_9EURO|nr:hypothetical protein LTR24_000181 [Lithohypha guttulata]KAK5330735.1 hypothetical protein LTR70_000057 [Exophiala xenobiotica]
MAHLSSSPILRLLSTIFATIFIGFGINAILQPASALSFFEWEYPTPDSSKRIIDGLLLLYGVRDIFMGLAIYVAAWYGDRRTLGGIVVCASVVAGADGWVCRVVNGVGGGEWGHWGYAPVVFGVGVLCLGVLDG